MCRPGENEYMSVDTIWGIMPPSGMCLSIFRSNYFNFYMLL